MSRPWTEDVETENGVRMYVKRCCNGCGRKIGDVNAAELEAAVCGADLPDVREECGCLPPAAPALAEPCEHDTLGCRDRTPHDEHTKVGDGRPCCGWPPRCTPAGSDAGEARCTCGRSPGRRHYLDCPLAEAPAEAPSLVELLEIHEARWTTHGWERPYQVMHCAGRCDWRLRQKVSMSNDECYRLHRVHVAEVLAARDAEVRRAAGEQIAQAIEAGRTSRPVGVSPTEHAASIAREVTR